MSLRELIDTPSSFTSAIAGGAADGTANAIIASGAKAVTGRILPPHINMMLWAYPTLAVAAFCFAMLKLIELDVVPAPLAWLRPFVLHGTRGAVSAAVSTFALDLGKAAMDAKKELAEAGINVEEKN